MLDFSQIEAIIFDMDGVLWRGSQTLPGVPEMFNFLCQQNVPFVFATNNSARTPQMYVEKLNKVGVEAAANQIVTSAIATALYLRQRYPDMRKAYVVGKEGLVEALSQQQFEIVDEVQADLVAVGYDPGLTYAKLRQASYHIQGGALLVGTNPDVSFPEPDGFAPGAGSIIAAIEAATGVEPLIVGKPHPPMFEAALEILNCPAAATLMVGDRLETDIAGANRVGLKSALVLTGVSTREMMNGAVRPDGIYEDLVALQADWQNGV